MAEENTILGGEGAENVETGVTGEQTVTGGAPAEGAPAQSGAFDYGKMIGSNGELSENWREGLPENIRGEKCLDSIKTIGTLAQSYVHAQKSIGANRVAIPGENATQEEREAFYKACGRPETEEKYETGKVSLPEGIELDENEVKAFRKFAYANGFSQGLFEKALSYDIERVKRMQTAREEARQAEYNETLTKLQSEYGDKFEQVVAQCNKAMQTFGLADVLREKGLLSNYTIIKALAGIGERIGESRLKGGEGAATVSDPQSRLNAITQNPDDPYFKREHPAHHARVQEVNNLLQALAKTKK